MSDKAAGLNVLITGASRGLGRELARGFWKEGANLLLTARSETALQELRTELSQHAQRDQRVDVRSIDLSLADSVPTLVAYARELWSRVDVLINNAAVLGPVGKAWENDWDQWQPTIRVDLLAPIELCRAIVPWMVQTGGGRIVNLSGGGASGARQNFAAYATAKTGLVRFSETLAQELHDSNVQVNCVAPGVMDTQMQREIALAGPDHAGAHEYARAIESTARQALPPTRVVDLFLFLATTASREINGRLISAVWDPWESLNDRVGDLKDSDIYTLRRIRPNDRGKAWKE